MSLSCPPGTFVYIIQPGDTYYRIAREYKTTINAIILADPGVNPNLLQIGQRICVPGAGSRVCPPSSTVYRILPGDNLYSLARRFDTSIEAIMRANPEINPANLRIGQAVCIPLPVGECPPGSESYNIRSGDTFYNLARRYDTTVQTLIALNPGINPNALRIGQSVCVPRPRLIYANQTYKVTFGYPADWTPVSEERYEGTDGFFMVGAVGGPMVIQEVCQNEAFHVLRPYGTSPTIQRLTLRGQEACLILPSTDQPQEMRGQAALIVRYPAPVTIGGQVYQYFILYADRNHIREFADSLEFLP